MGFRSPPRVLITGAAGFLGSHLCDRFLSQDWRVVGDRAHGLSLPPQEAREGALQQPPVATGEHGLAGAMCRGTLAQRGQPLEVRALAARSAAGIGHIGDPSDDGRLTRWRRPHANGKLAVFAQLDAWEPAAASGQRRIFPYSIPGSTTSIE